MNHLAQQITTELRLLIGQPLSGISRAADMQMFGFGPCREITNRQGEIVARPEISLHVQCRWRMVDGRSILFGRDDLLYPANKEIPVLEFDYDEAPSVLDATSQQWWRAQATNPPRILDATGDAYGGFQIELEGGLFLEAMPCDSARSEENWRLFGHRDDDSHFVVCGYGVEDGEVDGLS